STKATFQTTANQIYYDLFSLIPTLAPSITDQMLITTIQRHLMEPVSATSWVGTEQFTYDQVVAAIQKRLDRFKLETGLVLKASEFLGPVANESTIDLDDKIVDIRHVLGKDRNGLYSLLWRTDEFSLTAASPNWYVTADAPPTDYSTTLQQPLSM